MALTMRQHCRVDSIIHASKRNGIDNVSIVAMSDSIASWQHHTRVRRNGIDAASALSRPWTASYTRRGVMALTLSALPERQHQHALEFLLGFIFSLV